MANRGEWRRPTSKNPANACRGRTHTGPVMTTSATTTSATTTSATTTTVETTHPTPQSTRRAARRAALATNTAAAPHDFASCAGCDHVAHIQEIALWVHESVHTLYKWSAIGFPVFPKRLRLRNGRVATTCRLAKAWLAEVAS